MTAMDKAALAAHVAAAKAAGVTVRYERGADSVVLTAIPGRDQTEVDGLDQLRTSSDMRDYLLIAADLVLAGQTIEPKAGDRLHQQTTDGQEIEYTVMSPGGGLAAWNWRDQNRQLIRVHTRRTGVAA